MYAIIKTGGKQYRVAEGDQIFVEKLPQTLKPKLFLTKFWLLSMMEMLKLELLLLTALK